MNEYEKKDVGIKSRTFWFGVLTAFGSGVARVATVGLAIWGASIAYSTYVRENERRAEERRKEIEARETDYRTRFFERQLALYLEACEVSTRISYANTGGEAKTDRERFNVLISQMRMVATDKVMVAAVEFWDHVRDLKDDEPIPRRARDYACYLDTECRYAIIDNFPHLGIEKKVTGACVKPEEK